MEIPGTGYDRDGHDHPCGCMCQVCIKNRKQDAVVADEKIRIHQDCMTLCVNLLRTPDSDMNDKLFMLRRLADDILKAQARVNQSR